jgi:hypothetical protein
VGIPLDEMMQVRLYDRQAGLTDEDGPPVVIALARGDEELAVLSLDDAENYAHTILAVVHRGRIPKDQRPDIPEGVLTGTVVWEHGPGRRGS